MEVWETRAVFTAKTALTAAAVVGRELFVGSDDGSARVVQLSGAWRRVNGSSRAPRRVSGLRYPMV
jgi:hypothetical protein